MTYHQPESLIPANELERLRTLYRYQVLNSAPEKVFDDFVALTAQFFNLPISLISFVDAEEVFFKANAGMDGLPERLPRPDSLCSAVVLEETSLAFPDLTKERCNLVNPAVAESAGLRCYAGAPLRMSDGNNIGTLCVIGREARAFSGSELSLLSKLAELVSLTVVLRRNLLDAEQLQRWDEAQHELQAYLLESATLARYLAARTSGAAYFTQDLQQTVDRRLHEIERVLQKHLVEVLPT